MSEKMRVPSTRQTTMAVGAVVLVVVAGIVGFSERHMTVSKAVVASCPVDETTLIVGTKSGEPVAINDVRAWAIACTNAEKATIEPADLSRVDGSVSDGTLVSVRCTYRESVAQDMANVLVTGFGGVDISFRTTNKPQGTHRPLTSTVDIMTYQDDVTCQFDY